MLNLIDPGMRLATKAEGKNSRHRKLAKGMQDHLKRPERRGKVVKELTPQEGWSCGFRPGDIAFKRLNANRVCANFDLHHSEFFNSIDGAHLTFLESLEDGNIKLREHAELDPTNPTIRDFVDGDWIDYSKKERPFPGDPTMWGNSPPMDRMHKTVMKKIFQMIAQNPPRTIFHKSSISSPLKVKDAKVLEIFRIVHVEGEGAGKFAYLHPQGYYHNITGTHFLGSTTDHERDWETLSTQCLIGMNWNLISKGYPKADTKKPTFGDYVILFRKRASRSDLKWKSVDDWTAAKPHHDLILGTHGIYDYVQTHPSPSQNTGYSKVFAHLPVEDLWKELPLPLEEWINHPMESIPMIVGSNVARNSLIIKDDGESLHGDDGTIVFVPTWKNRKSPKEVVIGRVGHVHKHDLIRCSMCNAPAIIKAPLDNTQDTAQCPHCDSPEGLSFSHLIDGAKIQVVFPRRDDT